MKTKILIIAPRHYVDELRSYYIPSNDIELHYQYEEPLLKADLRNTVKELLSHDYRGFIGLVDWSSLLASYLNQQVKAPAPNSKIVAALQDKLLSRQIQAKCVKYRGIAVDSSKLDSLKGRDFPLFMKPRRATMSLMAQQVNDSSEAHSILTPRKVAIHDKQNKAWAKLYDFLALPEKQVDGLNHFIIESLAPNGIQITLDGFIQSKKVGFFGFTKSTFYPNHISFKRFDYPCYMPSRLARKIQRHAKRFVKRSGFNNSLFNIEYIVDIEKKSFTLLEINTRPSSQFMYPIQCVTGIHPLDIAIDIVAGKKPRQKSKITKHQMASVCVLRRADDAILKKIPSEDAMKWFSEKYPLGRWKLYVMPGEKLSDYPNDSRSYRYAELVVLHKKAINVHDYEDELKARFDKVIEFEKIL